MKNIFAINMECFLVLVLCWALSWNDIKWSDGFSRWPNQPHWIVCRKLQLKTLFHQIDSSEFIPESQILWWHRLNVGLLLRQSQHHSLLAIPYPVQLPCMTQLHSVDNWLQWSGSCVLTNNYFGSFNRGKALPGSHHWKPLTWNFKKFCQDITCKYVMVCVFCSWFACPGIQYCSETWLQSGGDGMICRSFSRTSEWKTNRGEKSSFI